MEVFLGFMNYHRDFIPQFAALAQPLYEMLGKRKTFVWQEVHQQSFERLKDGALDDKVLAFPNSRDMFILDTDASDHALGVTNSPKCLKVAVYLVAITTI